ncbi:beta-N-acetylhexosaminidase [Streptoalloteichus hindustanus]|uniref:beta-N-acetylhexosaminidase n=1 Tax=Streptoalloteichus hindustanus TaxID=2017 RepID=A0A1M4XH88_STRHI|nr:beta-N-acetylhexosaminidase [Streptoalloteichus hindustanus]SHE92869.1 hexosaminidase [Streptoalloteichus hindustanus]
MRHARWRALLSLLVAPLLLAGLSGVATGAEPVAAAAPETRLGDVVPAPVESRANPDETFSINPLTRIQVDPGAEEVAEQLADLLRRSTGYWLPVMPARGYTGNAILLRLGGADPRVGAEGYQLDVTTRAVTIRAERPAGLFAGVQTLRQLLPPSVESDERQRGPWRVPGGTVLDYPRFGYRATMLDVARHFLTVDEVKRHIDRIALYKINYLHLHLSDDQGWRIEIQSWPRLAAHGGSTEVGGGPGGYYTQDQYRDIVEHARRRHVTVVPEIDVPGHTNAALASYAELNCDGKARPLYTGTEVGFSSLCVPKEITYRFVEDVVRELAALTPGPYLHLGGDETHATSPADYRAFVERALPIVRRHGKTPVGWHEIANATTPSDAVLQYWGRSAKSPAVVEAAKRGNKVIMSPANRTYLDMKYDRSTKLGLTWAGYIEVRDAYGWEPGGHLADLPESSVLGVESPLWTETLTDLADVSYMAFPRLPAIAELGWSPKAARDWDGFRERLGAQGPRWERMGIGFHRSPQIPWR